MSTSITCESQHAADVCVSEAVARGSELSLVEMTEVEYLQHIIQSHVEAQVTETASSGLSQLEESLYEEPEKPHSPLVCRPEGTSACPRDTGPEDLLLLSDSNMTPVSSAEVPGSVLSRVQCVQERSVERPLEDRPIPAARVCLEKRFLSVLCHSTNTSGTPSHETEKWSKPDRMVKIHEGCLLRPQSELVIPAELTVSFRADLESVRRAPLVPYTDTTDTLNNEVVDKAVRPIKHARTRPLRSSNIMQDQENWKPYARTSGTKRCRTGPLMDRSQRKEVHNRKERDRRRRIRLCCDELNLLVPFCYADTDKATTLQWTTAFLKYIQEIHGDRLKQDFQSTFCGKTGLRLKPSCVSMAHLQESYKTTPSSHS